MVSKVLRGDRQRHLCLVKTASQMAESLQNGSSDALGANSIWWGG